MRDQKFKALIEVRAMIIVAQTEEWEQFSRYPREASSSEPTNTDKKDWLSGLIKKYSLKQPDQ